MKNWIALPRIEGKSSRQAHADLPEGTYERELGREGFFGPATHMYHSHPPTGWRDWEGPLRPRAFDLNRIEAVADDPWGAATVLHNAHVNYRFWRTAGAMDALARNADGDDLLFIHKGEGHLYCDYGHLEIEAGDYIVLPRFPGGRGGGEIGAYRARALEDKAMIERFSLDVIAGLDPAIYRGPSLGHRWTVGSSPRVTKERMDLGRELGRVKRQPMEAV